MLIICIVNTGWQGEQEARKAMAQIWKSLFLLSLQAQKSIKGQCNWDTVELCIILAPSSLLV